MTCRGLILFFVLFKSEEAFEDLKIKDVATGIIGL